MFHQREALRMDILPPQYASNYHDEFMGMSLMKQQAWQSVVQFMSCVTIRHTPWIDSATDHIQEPTCSFLTHMHTALPIQFRLISQPHAVLQRCYIVCHTVSMRGMLTANMLLRFLSPCSSLSECGHMQLGDVHSTYALTLAI